MRDWQYVKGASSLSTMKAVTVREAQHHLTKVLRMVDDGDDVVLTRRGKKIAKISAIGGDGSSPKVNWKNAREEIRKSLVHLPKLEGSSVDLLRELD